MRGEYNSSIAFLPSGVELPPRARRILSVMQDLFMAGGTTSACAENTPRYRASPPTSGNYLRVRGEYMSVSTGAVSQPELPPRARRILKPFTGEFTLSGTTSACAENTVNALTSCFLNWNYLRVRGEYK